MKTLEELRKELESIDIKTENNPQAYLYSDNITTEHILRAEEHSLIQYKISQLFDYITTEKKDLEEKIIIKRTGCPLSNYSLDSILFNLFLQIEEMSSIAVYSVWDLSRKVKNGTIPVNSIINFREKIEQDLESFVNNSLIPNIPFCNIDIGNTRYSYNITNKGRVCDLTFIPFKEFIITLTLEIYKILVRVEQKEEIFY